MRIIALLYHVRWSRSATPYKKCSTMYGIAYMSASPTYATMSFRPVASGKGRMRLQRPRPLVHIIACEFSPRAWSRRAARPALDLSVWMCSQNLSSIPHIS